MSIAIDSARERRAFILSLFTEQKKCLYGSIIRMSDHYFLYSQLKNKATSKHARITLPKGWKCLHFYHFIAILNSNAAGSKSRRVSAGKNYFLIGDVIGNIRFILVLNKLLVVAKILLYSSAFKFCSIQR